MGDLVRNCLLLEPDDGTAQDIRDSLLLEKFQVLHTKTPAEARAALDRVVPELLLVRINPPKAEGMGKEFLQSICEHPIFKKVPILGTHEEEEVRTFSEEASSYFRQILLPVTFPRFTREVARAIDDFEEEFGPIVQGVSDISIAASEDEIVEARPRAQSRSLAVSHDLERTNIEIVYLLQLRILEALRADGRIFKANRDEIPQILTEVTNSFCSEVQLDSL